MLVACSLPLAAHQKISDNSSGKHPAAGRGPPGTTAASRCINSSAHRLPLQWCNSQCRILVPASPGLL